MKKESAGLIKVEFDGFEWDLSNATKVQKHKVTLAEIESLFESELLVILDWKHSKMEKRYIAVGVGKSGRRVFVAYTLRDYEEETFVRVISARYMHRKEEKIYENLKKNFQT